MNRKEPQVVMITGASKGLGRSLALAFASQGAKLALCARGSAGLEAVKREAEAKGAASVLTVAADIASARDVERFVALTEHEFGRIDVLINNASALGPSPMPMLLDYPEDDFAEVLRVNAVGTFLVTRRVIAGMLRRGSGSVILVTSEAGSTGYAGWGAYGISKFAVEGMTETWAAEVEGTGVTVNMVDPGEMNTDMHALAVPDCDYALAEPDEVTDVFLYLASDQAKAINGRRFEAQTFRSGDEEEAGV